MNKSITSTLVCLFFFAALQAQTNNGFKKVVFQTNGTCNSCKNKIEYALAYEKGVKTVNYDLATSKVSVTYNEKKTTPQKLQKVIQDLGYKADIPAAPKAGCGQHASCGQPSHNGQPAGGCCKKEGGDKPAGSCCDKGSDKPAHAPANTKHEGAKKDGRKSPKATERGLLK